MEHGYSRQSDTDQDCSRFEYPHAQNTTTEDTHSPCESKTEQAYGRHPTTVHPCTASYNSETESDDNTKELDIFSDVSEDTVVVDSNFC